MPATPVDRNGQITFRFSKGANFLAEVTSERLNAIIDANNMNAVTSVSGGNVKKSPTGSALVFSPGSDAEEPSTPWKITTRTNPDDPARYQAMVSVDSDLLYNRTPGNYIIVTGLGTWFDFIATDVIWIYMPVSAGSIATATIQSYGMGNSGFNPNLNAWDPDGGWVQDDGGSPPVQIALNVMIAYSIPDSKGKPFLVQAASTHFLIITSCIEGLSAEVVVPSPYRRYGITAPGV